VKKSKILGTPHHTELETHQLLQCSLTGREKERTLESLPPPAPTNHPWTTDPTNQLELSISLLSPFYHVPCFISAAAGEPEL
jgi:hypothetical protein